MVSLKEKGGGEGVCFTCNATCPNQRVDEGNNITTKIVYTFEVAELPEVFEILRTRHVLLPQPYQDLCQISRISRTSFGEKEISEFTGIVHGTHTKQMHKAVWRDDQRPSASLYAVLDMTDARKNNYVGLELNLT